MYKAYKEIFKNLRQMQDQLWKDSLSSFPGSAFPRDLNDWQQKTLENVNNWVQQAVSQSLELQREWLDQWSGRVSDKKLKPKSFADLSAEAQDSMQRWLDNQNRLWDQWLQVLKGSGDTASLPNFGEWEKAVQDSVQHQMVLLKDWSEMADFKKLSTKEMTKLSDQIVKSMEKSIETQQQLWSHWFEELGAAALTSAAKEDAPAESPPKTSGRPAAKVKKESGRPVQSSDDLKQISGIGPGIEKKLKENGIVTLGQIAELSDQAIADLEEKVIRFSGRIKREQWVEQARKLIS